MREQTSLSINKLFKQSWKIFVSNWRTYVLIALVLLLGYPAITLGWYVYIETLPVQPLLAYSCLVFSVFALILIYLWATLTLIIAIRDRKEKIGVKESFRRSWPKIFDFFIVSFLTFVIILLGFLLLIIPGIISWAYLSLVSFVLVCENIKGRAALKRSWALVRGHWWEVFAKLLLLIIVIFVVSFVVSFGLSLIGFIFQIFILPLKWLLPILYDIIKESLDFILTNLTFLITFPFSLIYTCLIYEDLKGRMRDK